MILYSLYGPPSQISGSLSTKSDAGSTNMCSTVGSDAHHFFCSSAGLPAWMMGTSLPTGFDWEDAGPAMASTAAVTPQTTS